MSKNTRKTIIHLLANEIRNTMQTITLPYIDKYSFETIKTLTTLIDELLSDSIVKKEYVDKLSKSNESENAKNIEEKLETYKLRQKTMGRQEDRVMKKLQEMQASIEKTMKGMNLNSEPSDVE